MSKAPRERKAVDPDDEAADAAGRAGEARAGDADQLAAGSGVPGVLTPDDLRHIGKTLNGAHWQADIASLIGCSKSQVTRFLNGQRQLNTLMSHHLQYVIVERINQLIDLLEVDGMPYAGTQEAQEAALKVRAAIAAVPGMEPPRDH